MVDLSAPREKVWCDLIEESVACQKCEIGKTAKNKVFCSHRSCPEASVPVVIIGEAPGKEEDEEGVPFVGKSGRFLRINLQRIGLRQSKCAVINCVQCRPERNRKPSNLEIENCHYFFMRKIMLLNPSYLVLLGATAAKCVLKKTDAIRELSNKEHLSVIRGIDKDIKIPTIVIPHPSWGIRGNQAKFMEKVDDIYEWLYPKDPSLFRN